MRNYMEEYQRWLDSPALSNAEWEELNAIRDDKKEIESRFFAPLEFGTAGLRGEMALGCRRMNIHVIRHATQAFAEVIKAEGLLRQAGLAVEVKGPPPQLRTGCDMVVVFELVSQAAVLEVLNNAGIRPDKVVTAHDVLLEPVSLYQVKRLDHWLMVRAANMKITLDTRDGRIVNISGGGCPDVPWLAHCLCGMRLDEAPEPRSLGQTLCCYSLQKAYEELRRQYPCGI